MYSLGVNNNSQCNNYNTVQVVKASTVQKTENKVTNPISSNTSFMASIPVSNLRTELTTNTEKQKYSQLLQVVDKDTRKNLDILLKTGVLLNSDSNDKSTTLDNLYKIASNPRVEGLSTAVILKDTISTITNPHVITQQFGNIPASYQTQVKSLAGGNDYNVEHSGTCVASSVEYNLASRHPAEFVRFAEGLSSKSMSVNKTIKFNNLADNLLDAVWLLNAFEIPFKADNYEEAHLTFAPDKNAIIRAHIQTVDRDKLERSPLDVLMQSTFMQVGSQQSYDSLTDTRAGKFNQNPKGLIEFEKTFTESVVEDKNKISVSYQKIDDNGRLVGYETDFGTMKKQITDTLNMGENVIIGYTYVDETNTVVGGHEITIKDAKMDKNGKLIFVCHDTDDSLSKPVEYSEDYLLPKIHHAALPQEIIGKDMNLEENWVQGLRSYKEMKNQPKS